MTIYPDKQDIGIAIFLSAFSACTALLFHLKFNSTGLTFAILLFCGFWAVRYYIAFGRTITLDTDGITVFLLCYRRQLNWDRIRVTMFNSDNCIGYKDVATTGVEFLNNFKIRPRMLSPSTYCLFFAPWSYVFLNFTESVLSPKGTRYTNHYQVKKTDLINFIESNGIFKD